jgi:hypothetical protein
MNRYRYFVVALCVVAFGFVLPAAGTAAPLQQEIEYLLNAIRTSDCVFIRNGSRHDPAEAEKHIRKKYNYLKKRIHSTEDFIQGAATKSSLSGKPYLMICNNVEIQTADWLRDELEKYRAR